jgi:uncharacterized protein
MKSFKKIIRATVIFLIIASIAGIIYVLQFQEEPSAVKEPAKETKRIKPEKAAAVTKAKSLPVKPVKSREIAIIVDDIGYSLSPVKELLKINADLTFAVLPFQAHSRAAAEMLHKAKKETLLHLPMEPVSYPREKPGEGSLFTDMNDDELVLQLKKDIADVPYVSGVNNHMGSKFMTDENKLVLIFNELKKKKLFFVDSRTSSDTKANAAAKKTGLKIAGRKIFIDNNLDYNKIYNILINVAQNGDESPEIIIGHPHSETIRAIKDAVKVLREKGITVVPVSRIINE